MSTCHAYVLLCFSTVPTTEVCPWSTNKTYKRSNEYYAKELGSAPSPMELKDKRGSHFLRTVTQVKENTVKTRGMHSFRKQVVSQHREPRLEQTAHATHHVSAGWKLNMYHL